jgi:hypothetical protein
MALDRTTWSGLAVSYFEAFSNRMAAFWAPYANSYVSVITSSNATRTLAGEGAARYHSIAKGVQLGPRIGTSGLTFEIDPLAESAGPRYVPIPKDFPPKPTHNVARVSGSGNLAPDNVVVRVESGRLSVTIVGLQTALNTNPIYAAGPQLIRPSGTWHLHISGPSGPLAPLLITVTPT